MRKNNFWDYDEPKAPLRRKTRGRKRKISQYRSVLHQFDNFLPHLFRDSVNQCYRHLFGFDPLYEPVGKIYQMVNNLDVVHHWQDHVEGRMWMPTTCKLICPKQHFRLNSHRYGGNWPLLVFRRFLAYGWCNRFFNRSKWKKRVQSWPWIRNIFLSVNDVGVIIKNNFLKSTIEWSIYLRELSYRLGACLTFIIQGWKGIRNTELETVRFGESKIE